MTDPTTESTPADKTPAGVPAWYVYTVGLLLLAILASLLAMTLTFHRRMVLAEAAVTKQKGFQNAMMQTFADSMAPRLNRDDLPRAEVTVNDQPVRALIVNPLHAQALGLQYGDVLIVAETQRPTTTTSAPSGP